MKGNVYEPAPNGTETVNVTDDDVILFKPGMTFRITCCDCDLVHDVKVVKSRGGVGVNFVRNNRRTAERRRHRK